MKQLTPKNSDKKQLRKTLREKRRQLSTQQQLIAQHNIDRQLGSYPGFIKAQHIAFYLANDGEINPAQLLIRAHQAKKKCYLPVLTPDGKLWFRRYSPNDHLKKNKFGIPEPSSRLKPRSSQALDIVFMPLVGFDRQGGRLGMGGGFYDKSFAWIKKQPLLRKPERIGLAHECQEVKQLELEHWDIPLSAIATDRNIIII